MQLVCELLLAAELNKIELNAGTVIVNKLELLEPAILVAKTEISPVWPDESIVTVMLLVPWPAVILQPVGTAQV